MRDVRTGSGERKSSPLPPVPWPKTLKQQQSTEGHVHRPDLMDIYNAQRRAKRRP